jgi:uncharacterized protein
VEPGLPVVVALVAAVGFGAGFVKAAFGIGGGALVVAPLAAVLDPRFALGITAPVMLITDLTTIRAHWRRWHWPTVRVLAPAALAGIALGALFVARASPAGLRRGIGVVAILFAAVQAWRLAGGGPGGGGVPARPVASGALAAAYGLTGGVASVLAHSGGLLFAFYMLPRLAPAPFVASLALLLLLLDALKVPFFVQIGAVSAAHLAVAALLTPLMLVGSALGERVNGRVSERAFVAGVSALVFATGCALLVR